MIDIFQKVKGRLIVSCQAEEGSPFNSPEGVGALPNVPPKEVPPAFVRVA